MGKAQELDRNREDIEERIRDLIGRMSLDEKIGQLNQVQADAGDPVGQLADMVRTGRVGSVINLVDPEAIARLQSIAVSESRSGIPLLIGRDVIHGFQTIAPLPLGQAASFNPDLVRQCARLAAEEASAAGVNWTFAPMLDVCRDPRWGRIAESFGEDPVLVGRLGAAMVEGFQESETDPARTLIACAKHFAGYGASESGRDYNTTNIPENELRNVHLPPFQAALDAGAGSMMTSFSDLDGIPATASTYLLNDILREEWSFDGLVVSDWDAIRQLTVHGLCETEREATILAVDAGVDIDMVGGLYEGHLPELLDSGTIDPDRLDTLVANVLRVKLRAGLMDRDVCARFEPPSRLAASAAVREAAQQSLVLLKNRLETLPLNPSDLGAIAVIGPMADAPAEQLGTWVFDGDPGRSVTPLQALRSALEPEVEINYVRAMSTTRSRSDEGFDEAVAAAERSAAAVLFIGEEAILSGEAHCRADIGLPGRQAELVRRVKQTGTPVIGVIMAGRPLVLTDVIEDFDALIYAWHPGTLAGPAISDVLLGHACPSGKLPVTFPNMVGQIPIYYAHKNTGRPPSPDTVVHIDDIAEGAEQTSLGMTTFHLDAGYRPLFPFGFGLSYTQFAYANLSLDRHEMAMGETVGIELDVSNIGGRAGIEIVQLYIRDRFGSLTRPVRELKEFQRVALEAGETRRVRFNLTAADLSFHRRNGSFGAETGDFDIWVGGSSVDGLHAELKLTD